MSTEILGVLIILAIIGVAVLLTVLERKLDRRLMRKIRNAQQKKRVMRDSKNGYKSENLADRFKDN